jgi:putative ABC transport system permease protein
METLRIAAVALRTNKLRSFLTLLGVIIGVMTVVTVVSIISGLNAYISEKVFDLNPDVFVVSQFGIITSREAFLEAVKRKKIDWRDFENVRDGCQTCSAVGVQHRRRDAIKRGAERIGDVRIIGSTANMAELNNLDIETGRFFTDGEERRAGLVVILGSDVRDALFGKLDPIGRVVRVGNQPMRVIGLLRKQGSVLGEAQDDIVYIPVSTWRKQFGARDSMNVVIKARGGIPNVPKAMDEVRVMLRSSRRTAFRSDDPFAFVTAEALQTLWKGISAGMFSLMIFISGISLVVGGIVIMNIMLVSVVERTREIGVRRALGARRRTILVQFLTEAALVTMVGGAIGTTVGVLASAIIDKIAPVSAELSPAAIVGALVFSGFIGVAFGTWPAYRASHLDPIESLRYE